MEQIRAEYQDMANIAVRVSNLAEEYAVCVDDIYEVIDSLQSDWKGSDNLAYANTANSYKDDMISLARVITDYSNFLGESANLISRTQDEIASQAGQTGN